jgi:hypothetical protein
VQLMLKRSRISAVRIDLEGNGSKVRGTGLAEAHVFGTPARAGMEDGGRPE